MAKQQKTIRLPEELMARVTRIEPAVRSLPDLRYAPTNESVIYQYVLEQGLDALEAALNVRDLDPVRGRAEAPEATTEHDSDLPGDVTG